jgi:hypothetical protein
MSHAYPPMTFGGEHRFDHWVAEGVLHREEVIEPFDSPGNRYLGHRTVFYTPKGEEWRIRAHKLIWQASARSGGWNEHLERLAWMEAAGFRALPAVEDEGLMIASYHADAKNDLQARMLESEDSVALVRFNLPGQEAKNFIDLRNHGPWRVGAERIHELNKHLRGSVAVVAHRNESG